MTQFKQLLKILVNHQIDFILIGGLAAIAQGCAFSTNDLDIVYKRTPENIKKIIKALTPLKVQLRGKDIPETLPFLFDEKTFKNILNLTLKTDLGSIDLLAEIPGFGSYEKMYASSDILDLFDLKCRVLSIEGLIKNKKVVKRSKDLNHIAELEELLKLKKN